MDLRTTVVHRTCPRALAIGLSVSALFGAQSATETLPASTMTFPQKATGIVVSVEPQPIDDGMRMWLAQVIGKDPKTWEPSLDDLPNEAVLITVRSVEENGKVSYITAGATRKNATYEVTQDYMKYVSVVETYDPAEARPPRIARYGISLRVRANVVAKSAKVDLGGLVALGVAANRDQVSGTLSVEVTGIQGRDVTNALPLPAQLSQESVIAAIQAAATIKSRIYDVREAEERPESGKPTVNGKDKTPQAVAAPPKRPPTGTLIKVQRIAEEKLINTELKQITPGVYEFN